MPDPRDLLPQPPWEGLPIPRGLVTPKKYTSLQLFTPSMKEKIITVWKTDRVAFWKYGTIRPYFNDVIVCLKGRVVRNRISGDEIAEELAKRRRR